jgi:DNA replication and repair protein RecF
MTLHRLEITDFRCIERAQLEFDPNCTLIFGQNGSGKTSLLEAIHVLSCGHTFRTHRLDVLVRQGADSFMSVGTVSGHSTLARIETIGVRGSRTACEAHIGGRRAKGFSELAAALPIQVIDPEVHRLLEDGPKLRRRFLDWGVFHVEPTFIDAWRRYSRALRQRNAALKAVQPRDVVSSWDHELVATGELVAQHRTEYLAALRPIALEYGVDLLRAEIHLEHLKGWGGELGLAAALVDAWPRDVRYKQTTVGPHRADIVVRVDGTLGKDRVSRGQQKLLVAALILAQMSHRVALGFEPGCLLLDDPAAELDGDNLKKLLAIVAKTPAQLIVTSLDLSVIENYFNGRKFHVKQGIVQAML